MCFRKYLLEFLDQNVRDCVHVTIPGIYGSLNSHSLKVQRHLYLYILVHIVMFVH